MDKKCDIFLCYRKSSVLLAKLFKKYLFDIKEKTKGEKDYGRIYYSDNTSEGNYKEEAKVVQTAQYAIIFIYKGFTKGFLKFFGLKYNDNCITGHELYYAAMAKKEGTIKLIFVDTDNIGFGFWDKIRLKRYFKLRKLLSNNEEKSIINDFIFHKKYTYHEKYGNNEEKSIINDFIFHKKNTYHERHGDYEEVLFKKIVNEINIIKPMSNKEQVSFGSYPQSIVKDEALEIKLLDCAYGCPTKDNFGMWKSYKYYYNGSESDNALYVDVEYDNQWYRGIYFFELRPFLTIGKKSYLNKINCKTNKVYWFRYEPLIWNVLTLNDVGNNDVKFLMLSKVIDSQPINYTVDDINGFSANNYEHSFVHQWLNNNFYDTAFTKEETKFICETDFERGKVFLLSVEEVNKYLFEFKERRLMPTDYAMYQGVYISNNPDWFLRTPYEDSDTDNYFISGDNGEIKEDLIIYTNGGIVPCIFYKK